MDRLTREQLIDALNAADQEWDESEDTWDISADSSLCVRFGGRPFKNESMMCITMRPEEVVSVEEFRDALFRMAARNIESVLDQINVALSDTGEDNDDDGEVYL